jgi:hypothetical protein
MLRSYKYRNLKGFEVTIFGYVIRCEKYTRNIPWELITHSVSHIRFNGYFIYAVKLWKKR